MKEKKSQKKWIRVLQFLAAYLVAAWTFLQFVDWILIRYSISPYWVDMLLWLFIGIIPSLLIYLYHQDRINKKVLKLREKIIFPLNAILLAIVLYFSFGNSDLGATTKEISYENALGELETKVITKEEFRVGIPIFNFESTSKDSTTLWMSHAINNLLELDLEQDKNVSPIVGGSGTITEKVNTTKPFYKFFVDGEFEIVDSLYVITPVIRSAKNGKELHRKTFSGTDFFDLIDDVSVYTREHIGIIQEMRDNYIDLEVKDFTTSSLEALKEFTYGRYDNATEIDKTYALAYYFNAIRGTYYSWGETEEQQLIDKAYEHRDKLPLQKQLKVLIQRHIAYNHWTEAEELVKLQLEIDPNDITFNNLLYTIYSETKNIDAYLKFTEERFKEEPNVSAVNNYRTALLLAGQYDKSLSLVKKYESYNPNNNQIFRYKTEPYLLKGDLEAAAENVKKIRLVHPDRDFESELLEKAITYQNSDTYKAKDFSRFIGEFRTTSGEQVIKYFEKDKRLISHSSNQILEYAIVAGENILILTDAGKNISVRHEFQRNDKGNVFRLKSIQFYPNRDPETFWYYKEDAIIKKADSLLKATNYVAAEVAYTDAIKAHPEHHYLKDALAHINYVKNTNSLTIKNQFERISGTYGPRKFWSENNKFYYKLGTRYKREILPISKTKYFSLSRYQSNYEFEFLENKTIASFGWGYDLEQKKWNKLDDENNYFLKE